MSVNPVTTALMPISQAIAWFFVLSRRFSFYKSVAEIASFYCAWALYNRFVLGDAMEFGYISMGALAFASYKEHQKWSIAATCLVLFNFLYFTGFVLGSSVAELAMGAKGSIEHDAIVWAYIFKAYFVSSILQWSTVLYKFLKIEHDYTAIGASISV